MTPEAFRASIAENRELALTKLLSDREIELARWRAGVAQALEHLDLNEVIQARTILGYLSGEDPLTPA